MADTLRNFVNKAMDEEITENYPHLRHPACVYAKVVSVSSKNGIYTTTLRILDKNKQKDQEYTDTPKVRTEIEVSKGDIVVAVLMYGDADPYIIGRCC